jgi:hypothetical protein
VNVARRRSLPRAGVRLLTTNVVREVLRHRDVVPRKPARPIVPAFGRASAPVPASGPSLPVELPFSFLPSGGVDVSPSEAKSSASFLAAESLPPMSISPLPVPLRDPAPFFDPAMVSAPRKCGYGVPDLRKAHLVSHPVRGNPPDADQLQVTEPGRCQSAHR